MEKRVITFKNQEERLLIERYLHTRWEFVYLFHYYDNIYKIGSSYYPELRLSQIKKKVEKYSESIANNMTMVHKIATPDSWGTEKQLHNCFNRFRHKGCLSEAFQLTSQQVNRIKSIRQVIPHWYIQGMEAHNRARGAIK